MFSDEILEQIFNDERVRSIPLTYQSTMIHVVEDILDEQEIIYQTEQLRKENQNATIHEPELLLSKSTVYAPTDKLSAGNKRH